MPKAITVNPEHLLLSASHADGYAEDVRVRHTAADANIEVALPGHPALAAAALSAKAAKWQLVSAALFTRLSDTGHALRTSGLAFHETDEANARPLDAIDPDGGVADLDL